MKSPSPDHELVEGLTKDTNDDTFDIVCCSFHTVCPVRPEPQAKFELGGELRNYLSLRKRLLAELPDIDQETLADTLEGITDLREMLAEIIRSALDDEALAAGLSTRLSDMKARIERFEMSAKRKRELALKAMNEAEIPKLLVADFTASLRHGAPILEVVEETKIPAAYWKPQPSKLDRQGLLAALKAGTAIEGVVLEAPRLQLSVRTK
jgi:hypothetical protein